MLSYHPSRFPLLQAYGIPRFFSGTFLAIPIHKEKAVISEVFMSLPGLILSRRFFASALPLLKEHIPDVMAVSAAGLVGEGSECLGLDDGISRDHDWGPAFCLWVPDELLHSELDRIEHALSALPPVFEGYPTRLPADRRMGRVGPLPIRGFYRRFLGMDHVPSTWKEWLSIPEYHLCSCTNGAVFMDEGGEFSAIREELLKHYPEDVRRAYGLGVKDAQKALPALLQWVNQ